MHDSVNLKRYIGKNVTKLTFFNYSVVIFRYFSTSIDNKKIPKRIMVTSLICDRFYFKYLQQPRSEYLIKKILNLFQVKVSADFHILNVFWVCKGDSSDEETEFLLQQIAGALRHELSTLRVMGEVPYVVFVKGELIIN